MSHDETNPHFMPIQRLEGQRSGPPPTPEVSPLSPEVAQFQRRDRRNQPLGSQGSKLQEERSKPPRGREIQDDSTLQLPRKQPASRKDQRPRQPASDPPLGPVRYFTPWYMPPHEKDQRVPDPQHGGKLQSPGWQQDPDEDHHHLQPAVPRHQDEHPQQPDKAKGTQPQYQEHDNYPLHPYDPSRSPEYQSRYQRSRHRQSSGSQKTKPITWLGAAFCAIFWIVIFLGGLIVLIIYLVYRPRNPRFEVSNAALNVAYVDAGSLLNADLYVLANFTNPNKKVSVDFKHMILDVYYGNTLIATQYIESFSTAKAESMLANVHMVTSQVRLPLGESVQLQDQIKKNQIIFNIQGVFRVRSKLGSFLRYSYRLYSHCTIMLSAPPNGVLQATRCRTKR